MRETEEAGISVERLRHQSLSAWCDLPSKARITSGGYLWILLPPHHNIPRYLEPVLPTPSECVVAEEPDSGEHSIPPPPRAAPVPPVSNNIPNNMTTSQREPYPSQFPLNAETNAATYLHLRGL